MNKLETLHNAPPRRILVTAAGGPAGINTLRLLSVYPHLELFAVDIDPHSAGQVFGNTFSVVAPFRDQEAYKADLKRLVHEWKIDVVIPTLADELHVIEELLHGLGVEVVVSSKDVVALCADKAKFYAWASGHFPEYMTKWQTLDHPLSWESDTYFVKPRSGRGSAGCKLATKSEVREMMEKSERPEDLIVMDVLPGTEWTVDAYIRKDGAPLYVVPRERIEVISGISRKGRTVKHVEIIRRTEAILSALPFRGPVCIQWKADVHGDPKLLEVNARMSGGAMITVIAGANPMHLLALELAGQVPQPVEWEEKLVTGYTEYKPLN